MTYFVSLKITALVVGLLYLVTHLAGALAPVGTAPWARRLTSNYPLGVALMLAATLWFVTLTAMMDLGEISNLRIHLCIVWAIAGTLVTIFVPGFLPLRALGCLLLLAAAVVLDAAFLALTPWRFALTLLAYLWVIAGMVLVYSPHLGRNAIFFATETKGRLRAFAWPGVAYGLLLIVLALTVF